MKQLFLSFVAAMFVITSLSSDIKAEERPFKISVEQGKASSCKDKVGLKLTITPTGGFKINKDYPLKLKIKADSTLSVSKSVIRKADAIKFGDSGAVFNVCYASANSEKPKGKIDINVKFSVCEKKRCLMFKEDVSHQVK